MRPFVTSTIGGDSIETEGCCLPEAVSSSRGVWYVVTTEPAIAAGEPLALVTVAAGLLIYPLIQGREAGWPAWTFASMAAALAMLAVFVVDTDDKELTAPVK